MVASIEHKERNYESPQYVLPSDFHEEHRLNTQHRLIKQSFYGLLYIAPIQLKEGSRVLESGVGTGKWMLEFASQIPDSIQIDGIDIASRLFPQSCPPNITLSIHSITSLPLSWDSRFIYVHQRLLMAALTTTMWKSAISEIFRILQPGGWVELYEMGKPPKVGPYSTKMEDMRKALWDHKELMYDHEHELPVILAEVGFTQIQVDHRVLPMGRSAGQYGVDGNKDLTDIMYAMKTPVLKAGGLGFVSNEEEYDEVVAKTSEEWYESNAVEDTFTFTARKPLL